MNPVEETRIKTAMTICKTFLIISGINSSVQIKQKNAIIVYIILAICYIILIVNDMTFRAFATYSSCRAGETGILPLMQEPVRATRLEC